MIYHASEELSDYGDLPSGYKTQSNVYNDGLVFKYFAERSSSFWPE